MSSDTIQLHPEVEEILRDFPVVGDDTGEGTRLIFRLPLQVMEKHYER